jgi:small subunit ribosomal protein S17
MAACRLPLEACSVQRADNYSSTRFTDHPITQLLDYPIRRIHRMAGKLEKVGVVVSNKMQKSIVVAVEWQVRHGLYGKTERRTSTFMVHDEKNEAKPGDMVEIVETRPMSRRKRWALKKVVRQAAQV